MRYRIELRPEDYKDLCETLEKVTPLMLRTLQYMPREMVWDYRILSRFLSDLKDNTPRVYEWKDVFFVLKFHLKKLLKGKND